VKRPRADASGVSIPPPQFNFMLVCSVLQGMRVCITFAARQCTDDLLTRSLVGSIAYAVRGSRCIHDCGVILIGHRGCRALVQEGPPLVFPASIFLVCLQC
jgi:hypothetical protein